MRHLIDDTWHKVYPCEELTFLGVTREGELIPPALLGFHRIVWKLVIIALTQAELEGKHVSPNSIISMAIRRLVVRVRALHAKKKGGAPGGEAGVKSDFGEGPLAPTAQLRLERQHSGARALDPLVFGSQTLTPLHVTTGSTADTSRHPEHTFNTPTPHTEDSPFDSKKRTF